MPNPYIRSGLRKNVQPLFNLNVMLINHEKNHRIDLRDKE